MNTAPAVTLIVLNYNAQATLADCLTSLLAQDYDNFSVVVVDNASTDDSAEIAAQFSAVTLMRQPTNYGFAAGNNVALRTLETPYAILVNPDVIADPGWLRQLMATLLSDASIGAVGCKLLYPDRATLQHVGGQITSPQAFPQHVGGQESDRGQYTAVQDVDYVIGATLALRRAALDDVGLLDEGYFLYYEDADLCLRLRRAGWRVVVDPRATAVHVESIATDRRSDFYWQQMFTSRWRYLLKHTAVPALLHETFPAEQAWLQTLAAQPRRAAAAAYHATLRDLPTIWQTRTQHGMTAVSPADRETIVQAVAGLRAQAWQPVRQDVQALVERAVVQERPFTSPIPLVAWLRERWSRVAAKWMVRDMVQQQNTFNQQLVGRLQEQIERLLSQEQGQAELVADTQALLSELRALNRQLSAIEARLARLEEE